MRSAAILLVSLALAGCGTGPTAPATVRPTLVAVEALGFRCGDGVKDNVPSGLFQWSCRGAVAGTRASVLVEGNDEGVASVMLVIDGAPDPGLARSGFGRLVAVVPPLSSAPDLAQVVEGWAGDAQEAWVVGGVRVSALCDAIQCIVTVVPAGDLLRPLPLP